MSSARAEIWSTSAAAVAVSTDCFMQDGQAAGKPRSCACRPPVHAIPCHGQVTRQREASCHKSKLCWAQILRRTALQGVQATAQVQQVAKRLFGGEQLLFGCAVGGSCCCLACSAAGAGQELEPTTGQGLEAAAGQRFAHLSERDAGQVGALRRVVHHCTQGECGPHKGSGGRLLAAVTAAPVAAAAARRSRQPSQPQGMVHAKQTRPARTAGGNDVTREVPASVGRRVQGKQALDDATSFAVPCAAKAESASVACQSNIRL